MHSVLQKLTSMVLILHKYMDRNTHFFIIIIFIISGFGYQTNAYHLTPVNLSQRVDSLPKVFIENLNLTDKVVRFQAEKKFMIHQLPSSVDEWESYRLELKHRILQHSGIEAVGSDLTFDEEVTNTVHLDAIQVQNLSFQTLEGAYATANLYKPEGNGPFPAVLVMMGHWSQGKLAGQPIGQTLARNGYVAMVIDPWGAGERGSYAGEFEYHGGNLGLSLINTGRSLLGIQVMDNMRAVDFLQSLEYVDSNRIGATGGSGGGNQTMWLSALDERIKAALPVVSVGTFESYVLGHNCVCEVLNDGLTFTEEAGVLGLIAPRALLLHNHHRESNPAFFPDEMKRSFIQLEELYRLYDSEERLRYDLFDLPHGYFQENREGLIGWFNKHLKGEGSGDAHPEKSFELLDEDMLLVYPGSRPEKIQSTAGYARNRGERLRENMLSLEYLDLQVKRDELLHVLRLDGLPNLSNNVTYSTDGGWSKVVLENSYGRLLPLLFQMPEQYSGRSIVLLSSDGKDGVNQQLIQEKLDEGYMVVLPDLYGTGETALSSLYARNEIAEFHSLSRAEIWLGNTMIGKWVEDLYLIEQYLKKELDTNSMDIMATKESGVAALSFAVFHDGLLNRVTTDQTPVTYLFDDREGIDNFSMAIHLPGLLEWGDLSLISALSDNMIYINRPVTMSGRALEANEIDYFSEEYSRFKRLSGREGKISFHIPEI